MGAPDSGPGRPCRYHQHDEGGTVTVVRIGGEDSPWSSDGASSDHGPVAAEPSSPPLVEVTWRDAWFEFDQSDPEDARIELAMSTLDKVIEDRALHPPHMLKLDVQGFELEVLRGATRTLKAADLEVVVMEVSLIDINVEAPLIYEVLGFMTRHHFSMYDICSFMRRPLDRALWQIDSVFVRDTSRLVASKMWR
jgi:FkbM family methyltransferase